MAFTLIAYLPLLMSGLDDFKITAIIKRFLAAQSGLLSRTLPMLVFVLALGCLVYLGQYQPIIRVRIADEMTQGNGLTRYPLGAVDFLRNAPYKGNLLIRFGLGEFLYWTLYPQYKVSMDGRYEEVYPQQTFIDNFKFFDKVNKVKTAWILQHPDTIHADFILAETDFPHEKVLLAQRDASGKAKWQEIFSDQCFIILGRTSTLEKYPHYDPVRSFMTVDVRTIDDYFTPADLKRFKN